MPRFFLRFYADSIPDHDPVNRSKIDRGARCLSAFTRAGISVEGGIPPFRGAGGLWNAYDHFGAARPNRAYEVLAAWEARSLLKTIITRNIDSVSSNYLEPFINSLQELDFVARSHRIRQLLQIP